MNLRPLALISVFALVLPACSGDDGETSASTTNATNTTNTTATTSTTGGSTSETTGGSGSGSDSSTSGGTSTTDPSTSGSSTGDPSTTGTTGDPSTTGTSTGGTTGGGGDPYDPDTCDGQPLAVQGIEGAFCSPACEMDADCPEGPMGTQGACALSTMMGQPPSNCALVCQLMNDACPEGSSCKDIMQMGLGICTYP